MPAKPVNDEPPRWRNVERGRNRAINRRSAKIGETAEYLGVTDRTIRQMVSDGRIRGYRSGTRLVRVDLNEIDAAIEPFGGAA